MASSHNGGGIWAHHLDKIGVGGTVLAALCCLGFPALLAVVSAIGLGFLVKNAILVPLLVAFLLIALAGLYLGTRRHGQWWAFGLGLASGTDVHSSGNHPKHRAGRRRHRRVDSGERAQCVASDPANSATLSRRSQRR